jgi:hypothetical protein
MDLASPFELAIGGAIFGSEAFAAQLRPLIRTPDLLEDVPEIRILSGVAAPSCDTIRSAVIETFPGLSEYQRQRISVYALRRFSNATAREIARMTNSTPSAATHAWRSLQARLASDISFRRQIDRLAGVLVLRTPHLSRD